jgi:endonuclease G
MPYDALFIPGCVIDLPGLGNRIPPVAFDGGAPVDHSRFSIVFNQERGFAVYTAHNIDGADIIAEGEIRRRDNFRLDPKVPRDLQVDNDRGYASNPWDRGHLVQRRSLHWGDKREAAEADSESFFWTNIVPQHTRLHHTAWGHIEDWMFEVTDGQDREACVFTGPVLTPDDPERVNKPGERPVRIPAGFWKIFAIKNHDTLRAAAFLVWQRDFDRADPVAFDPILEQVRITTIEYLTGLSFDSLRNADPLRFGTAMQMMDGFATAVPGSARMKPAAVTRPSDVVL